MSDTENQAAETFWRTFEQALRGQALAARKAAKEVQRKAKEALVGVTEGEDE